MLPDQNIEWTMATASNAKGWLPMWAQKMGVPSAVYVLPLYEFLES